jgi:hypothetical protein
MSVRSPEPFNLSKITDRTRNPTDVTTDNIETIPHYAAADYAAWFSFSSLYFFAIIFTLS